ncbi:hypothetical protein ACFYTG_54015 [Streptomyces mirabilis]|uniref:hypothetical protein n=1 Tax=Streptomyces mirabilis TaxID=68239 RepID=UPI00369838C6
MAHRRGPGGLVALAIPHSHLRTALVPEGCAARSRDGIHELVDIETVRAVADTPGVHRDSSAAESDVAWSTTRGCV